MDKKTRTFYMLCMLPSLLFWSPFCSSLFHILPPHLYFNIIIQKNYFILENRYQMSQAFKAWPPFFIDPKILPLGSLLNPLLGKKFKIIVFSFFLFAFWSIAWYLHIFHMWQCRKAFSPLFLRWLPIAMWLKDPHLWSQLL